MTDNPKLYKVSNDTLYNRRLFLSTSLVSVLCLLGSFGNPLQKLTVYHQKEIGLLDAERTDVYVITESDRNYPYGFIQEKAVRVAQIREDYKGVKIMLLALSLIASAYSLSLANSVISESDLEKEVVDMEITAKKELLMKRLKLMAALSMKEQSLEIMNQMAGLFESYGEELPEYENEELDEMAATNKHYQVMDLTNQGHSLEYAISQIYGLDKDSDEFKHVHRSYLEE